jgi:FlaA1/EpsC-like NDP-sugar epimerase
MESLFNEANQYKKTLFTIVRYGNVIGSTGSVIPKWKKAREEGTPIFVTNKEMVRFFMTVDQSVDLIFKSIKERKNIIPRDLKAINMWTLAEIVSQGKVPIKEIGKRAGERNFEVLIPDYEGDEFSTKNAKRYTKQEIAKLI